LEECIHYYLLQLPPPFTNLPNLESFIDEFNSKKLCVEFRNPSLFTEDTIQWAEKKGVLLVSVDAPNLPRKMMSRRVVYERLHGRTHWYTHDYSRNELLEIKNRMIHGQPDRMYIFFNNNHAMLKNAMLMRDLLV
jgi:uncharacterized protein YecE (DUF72 family)